MKKDELRDALYFYGFVIPLNEKISGKELAQKIEDLFNLDNPRNRHYCEIIKNKLAWAKKSWGGLSWLEKLNNEE